MEKDWQNRCEKIAGILVADIRNMTSLRGIRISENQVIKMLADRGIKTAYEFGAFYKFKAPYAKFAKEFVDGGCKS